MDIIETLWKYDAYIESGDLLDDAEETKSSGSRVTPPDEPFAPHGSLSLTPELTDPSENVVPRNISVNLDSEELISEQVNKSIYIYIYIKLPNIISWH